MSSFTIIPVLLFTLFVNNAERVGVQSSVDSNAGAPVVKWVVEKSSVLEVKGQSNVNTFTCNIVTYAKKDTITCTTDPFKPVRLTGNLQMDVLSFDCHSNLITNDLRKTLKADKYPKMSIRFLSLQSMPQLQHKTEFIKGMIEVELAGVVKQFELCYAFSSTELGPIQLVGSRNFCFSDFRLAPPQKMGGLIKIKDNFAVKFQLNLRAI
jgi:hypothetical protein